MLVRLNTGKRVKVVEEGGSTRSLESQYWYRDLKGSCLLGIGRGMVIKKGNNRKSKGYCIHKKGKVSM